MPPPRSGSAATRLWHGVSSAVAQLISTWTARTASRWLVVADGMVTRRSEPQSKSATVAQELAAPCRAPPAPAQRMRSSAIIDCERWRHDASTTDAAARANRCAVTLGAFGVRQSCPLLAASRLREYRRASRACGAGSMTNAAWPTGARSSAERRPAYARRHARSARARRVWRAIMLPVAASIVGDAAVDM